MAGTTQFWFRARLIEALDELKKKGNFPDAAAILSERWKRRISPAALKTAFQNNAIEYGQYISRNSKATKREKLDTGPAGDVFEDLALDKLTEDELTEKIVDAIQRTANALKLAPQDVTWADFRGYCQYKFGRDPLGQIAPRHITRIGGYNFIRDSHFPRVITQYSRERVDMRDRASIHRVENKLQVEHDRFLRQLQEVQSLTIKGIINPAPWTPKKNKETERIVHSYISDTHFRSMLDGIETPMIYGAQEEARRLAAIAVQVAEWKPQYRDRTKLMIHFNGDIVRGDIHEFFAGSPLALQVAAAQWLLSHYVGFLSGQYAEVEVDCVTGNHGRFPHLHESRAFAQKWNSVETAIYTGVWLACAKLPNVKFSIPQSAYSIFDCFGMKGLNTHGDTVIEGGSPDKTIKTKSVGETINAINASLPDADEYKMVGIGHVHTNSITHLSNGCVFVTNGALIPPDTFSVGIGKFENKCGQQVIESVPGIMVGDSRVAVVDRHTDQDESLEKVIPRFPGLPR